VDLDLDEKIKRLTQFKEILNEHRATGHATHRAWLNENVAWVRNEVVKAGCIITMTITAPPITGGAIHQNVDPFDYMFEAPYGRSLVSNITDMIEKTIGVLRYPVAPVTAHTRTDTSSTKDVQRGYAFIAMPMDKDDHQLVDVLEAIQESASSCEIKAERVDEVETNDRITDRILESIAKAEFVIVDLTKERPNVFFEAGYAHGLGKIPIYLARRETTIHFDLKDYPIIEFRNMRELKDKLKKRFVALSKRPKETGFTSPSKSYDEPTKALGQEDAIKIKTLDVHLEIADLPNITYKRKLRLVLQNVGDCEVIVGPRTNWRPQSLRTRHIAEHVWELEPKDGWYSGKWTHKEVAELRVPPGRAFRTWIGLHDSATESEITQLKGTLGTLTMPVRVVGRSSEKMISI
jgi:hypothetical protein